MQTLGFGIGKAVKWDLMVHQGRNMEDSVAEGDLNSGGLAQGFSEEKHIKVCLLIETVVVMF